MSDYAPVLLCFLYKFPGVRFLPCVLYLRKNWNVTMKSSERTKTIYDKYRKAQDAGHWTPAPGYGFHLFCPLLCRLEADADGKGI